ncbi:hypothetical protein LTR78_006361 [Recurvomyces mirabilis]|uniref:Uncharacterized protein n=1 Tax=Recurvomyces mirabilis TaxID=574656 RepID=A0AAE1C0A0_9PEZI|nr:hypothetical protein LTR78_006361 [Recurvomyces mirabilis]KAK5152249.1 hypothetical protein LTS14_008625 [Recurvomyces mirabilis]
MAVTYIFDFMADELPKDDVCEASAARARHAGCVACWIVVDEDVNDAWVVGQSSPPVSFHKTLGMDTRQKGSAHAILTLIYQDTGLIFFATSISNTIRLLKMQAPKNEQSPFLDDADSQAHLLEIPLELRIMIYDCIFADLLAGTRSAETPAQVREALQPTILHICRIIRCEAMPKHLISLRAAAAALARPISKSLETCEAEIERSSTLPPTEELIKKLRNMVAEVNAQNAAVTKKVEVIIKIVKVLTGGLCDFVGECEELQASMAKATEMLRGVDGSEESLVEDGSV